MISKEYIDWSVRFSTSFVGSISIYTKWTFLSQQDFLHIHQSDSNFYPHYIITTGTSDFFYHIYNFL